MNKEIVERINRMNAETRRRAAMRTCDAVSIDLKTLARQYVRFHRGGCGPQFCPADSYIPGEREVMQCTK